MAQHYSNPKRESDPYALPDIEVFYNSGKQDRDGSVFDAESETGYGEPGWYWWSCFPGCLPDGDPSGPFATEAEALADAREGIEGEEDDA